MIGGSEASSVALAALEQKNVLDLLVDSPYASVVLDRSGTIVYCSKAWLDLLQQTREAIIGLRLDALVALDDEETEWVSLLAGRLRAADVWACRPDGVRIPVHLSRSPIFDAGGDLVGVLCQAAARSAELEAVAAIQASEERFRAFVTNSSDIAAVFDVDGTITYVTPSVEAVSGYSVEELLGTSCWDYLHADDVEAGKAEVARMMSAGGTDTREWRVRHADGSFGWYEFTLTNLHGHPAVRGTVGNFRDITARHAADSALRESEQRFRRVLEHSSDAFLSVDSDNHITGWNPAAETMFGWTTAEALGRDIADLLSPQDRLTSGGRFAKAGSADSPTGLGPVFEMAVVSAAGRKFPVEVSLVQDNTGTQPQFQAFMRDITARKAEQARLTLRALTDPLTGLANRSLLHDRLGRALSRLSRNDGTGFKKINDTYGHEAGDELLVSIGDRIRRSIRTTDTVARYGGDEFVVIAEDIRFHDEPASIAERVIAAVGEPLELAGRVMTPSISVGIVSTASGGRTPDDLVRDADMAMYKAKEHGGGGFALFNEAMGRRAHRRLELEDELRLAIDHRELLLHYQPIVTLGGQIRAVEALLRWQHPRLGLLAPIDFIPLAEETGLVVELGRWVLEEASRQVVAWRSTVAPSLELSVNVATRQLADPGLPAMVRDILARTALPPSALCLEVTESGLLLEPEAAAVSLRALRSSGVKVAVDDFGAGYSSLVQLKRFPVQILKLDRLFVAGISQDKDAVAIAASVVRLAHAMGLSAVAEGVETAEQRAILEELGCEQAQGFLWSAAEAPEVVAQLLAPSDPLLPLPATKGGAAPHWHVLEPRAAGAGQLD